MEQREERHRGQQETDPETSDSGPQEGTEGLEYDATLEGGPSWCARRITWEFNFTEQQYDIPHKWEQDITIEDRQREMIWDPDTHQYIPVEAQPTDRPWVARHRWDTEAGITVIDQYQPDI